jgi:hypothetical protein
MELHVASPSSEAREVPDLTADIDKLEMLALQSRPEMAEEGYRARISADEARKALVALLPNLSLDLSTMHDSNKFLLNNTWTQAGIGVALNMVKIFSLPALNRSEEAQKRADEARRQAVAIAVLTQTRLAAVRYTLVADEFLVWDEAARDDDLIAQYLASSEKVGIDTELELIRARARAMASHMNRDLAYANVQATVARLYNSVGYDAVPQADEAKAVAELTQQVEERYGVLERTSFTARAALGRPQLVTGTVTGTDARTGALLREGIERVLVSSAMKAQNPDAADGRLEVRVRIGEPQEGRKPVEVTVSAMPRAAAATSFTRTFKTTLSEPIDDEQWRVLGEGAAYRLIGDLTPGRITRPSLKAATILRVPKATPAAAPPAEVAEGRREPLRLRLDPALGGSSVPEILTMRTEQ